MKSNVSKTAQATEESLHRIFTIPEAPDSTLSQIEQAISENLNRFLQDHIAVTDSSLTEIEKDFSSHHIPEQPSFVSDHTDFLLNKLVARSVHTSSPKFIGHMTSALPYFLMPLSKIMIALNQNTVKIETSKAFTPLERQVLGMLHHLIYQKDDAFYRDWMHSATHSLGAFCSGGTVANITALWVARNNALKADGEFEGVGKAGLFAAMKHYGFNDLAILVSERGHYSLGKAAELLGLGRQQLISVATDSQHRLCIHALEKEINNLKLRHIKPIAIVGIAGTTETGSVDPLNAMADICQREKIHFHVDAAWGGASLMSLQHRDKFIGIERADSVTIDAHKQFYTPMGAGMVLFQSSTAAKEIEHHANYILREGAKDLGSHTLEGSRGGMAMLLFAALNIIGRAGYQLLIDQSIDKARNFADLIHHSADFELTTEPELCLLTYRYLPAEVKKVFKTASVQKRSEIQSLVNQLTVWIQKAQRESGYSFVSRTRLPLAKYDHQEIDVFRVVLANPLTTPAILSDILIEQRKIAQMHGSPYHGLMRIIQSE